MGHLVMIISSVHMVLLSLNNYNVLDAYQFIVVACKYVKYIVYSVIIEKTVIPDRSLLCKHFKIDKR